MLLGPEVFVWRAESRGGGPDELFERCVAHGEEGGGRAGAWGMVDAAHVGCRVQDDGTVARAAFQLLHRRYPRSPWAAKTKYWYR